MSTKCNYLYGVVGADVEQNFGPIGFDGSMVRTVCQGGVGVVTGLADRIDFCVTPAEKTLSCLAHHQRVLEKVMAELSVIPLKLGTYADDDAQIHRIIQDGHSGLAAALEQYGGKVEIDLAITWTHLPSVLSDIARDNAVMSLKAQFAAADGTGVTTEQRIRLGQLVKRQLDQRRDNMAGQLLAALKADWPDMIVNPAKDDSTILGAAILMAQDQQAKLEYTVNQLDRLYDGRITFRCVGPLPPYSFATAEVKTIGASVLDGARTALGLGESASLVEIKAAHRRLVQALHPDRNAGAGAGGDMQEVASAYEILEEYVLNFKHTFGSGNGGVIVRVRSLNDLRKTREMSAVNDRTKLQPCPAGAV